MLLGILREREEARRFYAGTKTFVKMCLRHFVNPINRNLSGDCDNGAVQVFQRQHVNRSSKALTGIESHSLNM